MSSKYFICLIVLIVIQDGLAKSSSSSSSSSSSISVYRLELGDLYKMQTGLGWPHSLRVAEGHEALLKLARSLENQQSCEVTTPAGVSFNVQQPPSDRFLSWTDGCGLRVRNVVHADEGRWRLTAVSGNNTITGWATVHVEDDVSHYTAPPLILQDGEVLANISLTTLNSSYCLVAQPLNDGTLVPGQCNVTLDKTTRAVEGNWHMLVGLPGRVSELPVDRSISVDTERLDTGFIHKDNKLHIYCNIHFTAKNITFCRFQRTTSPTGFNLADGLSDGSHSYYGDGFGLKHCGITIENPTLADYTSWSCTVGVEEKVGRVVKKKRVGNVIMESTAFRALIRVTGEQATRSIAEKVTTDRTVFVQKGVNITIPCQTDAPLTYCWFQHPNGTQFTPVPLVDEEQLFWYSGKSLTVGDCSITFTHVTEEDSGDWTCHMGPRDEVGVEITDRVTVRVTGPLAAREKEVVATVGSSTTLYCHSSNGNRPLDYCRFLSPSYLGIRIDETVTHENAILDRFYFTADRRLNYGDCSLTIDPVLEEDIGVWTCAAMVDDEVVESRDTISLMVEVQQPILTFIVIGMSVVITALFLILAGVMIYKLGKLSMITLIPWRRTNDAANKAEKHPRLSTGSGESGYNGEHPVPVALPYDKFVGLMLNKS